MGSFRGERPSFPFFTQVEVEGLHVLEPSHGFTSISFPAALAGLVGSSGLCSGHARAVKDAVPDPAGTGPKKKALRTSLVQSGFRAKDVAVSTVFAWTPDLQETLDMEEKMVTELGRSEDKLEAPHPGEEIVGIAESSLAPQKVTISVGSTPTNGAGQLGRRLARERRRPRCLECKCVAARMQK